MKPNLILLNGPPGIGKSTLSQRYADQHPLALNIDVDRLWHAMGSWQDNREITSAQKYKFAAGIAEIHLSDGYNVVVADMILDPEIYSRFEHIALKAGAILHEIVLIAPVDEAIERCKARARAMGHPTGFRPGGILDTGGKEELLKIMYQQMLTALDQRPNSIRIESEYGAPDSTYAELISAIA